MRTRVVGVMAAAMTIAAALGGPFTASASTVPLGSGNVVTLGTDVSHPQCGAALPGTAAFVVVGVNDGIATGTNPCLQQQLDWAASTSTGAVELYANTGNPSPSAAAWWPSNNVTRSTQPVVNPYGSCAPSDASSTACSYVYGYSIALDDLQRRGIVNAVSYRWWLDVETSNDWSGDPLANRAVLEGMTSAFHDQGASVGIYSTQKQWSQLIGDTPASSVLAGLPSWRSGAVTRAGAAALCTGSGFTPGSVVQYAQQVTTFFGAPLDFDIACASLPAATPAVDGTPAIGGTLHADAAVWHTAGAALSVQWLRDGVRIPGATSADYVVQAADAGHAIRVRVTAVRDGYRRASAVSAAVIVPAPAPQPTPSSSATPSPAASTVATPIATDGLSSAPVASAG